MVLRGAVLAALLVFRLLLIALLSPLVCFGAPSTLAGDTLLEFEPVWGDVPLRMDPGEFDSPDGSRLTVSRLDLLLSGIALLKEDGTWLESRDWVALLKAGESRMRARLEGMPALGFTRIRFSIGLPAAMNSSDPAQYPSGHPLHPQENGLHWGWQGGYIFMALEGRVRQGQGEPLGFSYHLGNPENRVLVELPAVFSGKSHRTVRVRFDVSRLFASAAGVVPARDGTSTHSRPGDPVVAKLKAGLAEAFAVAGVSSDSFQDWAELSRRTNGAPPAPSVGTPFALRVSARLPRLALPADNLPTLEGVALGDRLFHEGRLSRNNRLACSGCHDRSHALADRSRRYSLGVDDQPGKRNAMPLFNLAWQREFFWDGRVTGLRHQALMPIQDAHEMAEQPASIVRKLADDPEYPGLFRRAFGDESITADRIGLALEQFMLTLISQDSKFDRAARGEAELTPQEQQGLRLFITENDPSRGLRGADCFHCHGGNLFTSGAYANNGLDRTFPDPGRFAVTGNEADRGKFRVPSLRNVEVTAPYMHDGRFNTLEEVVAHYNRGVRRSPTLDPNLAKHPQLGLALDEADQKALVAFLKTLTDAEFLKPQGPQTRNLTRK